VIVEALFRYRMLRGGTQDLGPSFVENDAQARRLSSLRWGIVLTSLGVAFALIEAFGWREVTPGVVALLAGFTGIGNLVYFYASRRLQ